MTARKIRFRQTGGFAGLVRGCDLNVESLDPKQRAEVDRLVTASGLATGAVTRPASRGRDLTQFEITIESVSGSTHSNLTDLDLDDKIEPLVAFLQRHAGPVPLD